VLVTVLDGVAIVAAEDQKRLVGRDIGIDVTVAWPAEAERLRLLLAAAAVPRPKQPPLRWTAWSNIGHEVEVAVRGYARLEHAG